MDYADAVIAGTVDAGCLAHLACERFNRDRKDGTWEFRPELAGLAMDFAGSMPKIEGGCEHQRGRGRQSAEHEGNPLDTRLEVAGKPAVLVARRRRFGWLEASSASTCTSAFAVRRRSL